MATRESFKQSAVARCILYSTETYDYNIPIGHDQRKIIMMGAQCSVGLNSRRTAATTGMQRFMVVLFQHYLEEARLDWRPRSFYLEGPFNQSKYNTYSTVQGIVAIIILYNTISRHSLYWQNSLYSIERPITLFDQK